MKRGLRRCLPSPPVMESAKLEAAAERATKSRAVKRISVNLKGIKLGWGRRPNEGVGKDELWVRMCPSCESFIPGQPFSIATFVY